MCLYPTLIKNRKYIPNKKNRGNPPPVLDERVRWVPVGCQECIECRKQKARGWQVRLLEDLKYHKNGKFITLTFSNESICKIIKYLEENEEQLPDGYELDNLIATTAMRLFLERWRKIYGKSLRHWMVTEVGHTGTENIHLHGIVWSDTDLDTLQKIWSYGFVWKGKEKNGQLINYVNERTVNYIVKYIHKVDEDHKTFKSKVLTSPGIGKGYTCNYDAQKNKFNGKDTQEYYRTRQGFKIAMPIYWRNKIYTEKEREQLWLQRLDKNERWICGERVDISQGEDDYYKILGFYRIKNKRLGYGTGEKTWEQREYERQRRNLMVKKRIENANETCLRHEVKQKG